MADNIKERSIDAYSQFENWLSDQPFWLQDAAYRIYHGLEIGEEQISSYADMCILQAKKQKTEYKHLNPNDSKNQAASSRMTVQKLSGVVGVNALAPDATLEFSHDGITVIYGLNGAGKSGFMRIFKQLSGSPFEEPIQPNVFKKETSEKPSCRFVINEDGQEQEFCCNLSSGRKDSPLANCDVFDTRISNDYISKNNNVSYQPFVFTVLAELANTADKIGKQIDQRIEAVSTTPAVIPKDFLGRDDIAWVQTISADTVFPTQFESWTEDQQHTLEAISKQLDTEKVTSDLQLCKSQIGIIKPILEDLVAAKKAIKASELAEAYTIFVKAKQRLNAAEKLFTKTADDYDKVSVSIADWKALWQAAQKYYNSIICKDGSKHFGEEGTICPLCHQLIPSKSISRFKSVNEYVNGTCSADYTEAQKALKKLLTAVTTRLYSEKQIRDQLSSVFTDSEISLIEASYKTIGSSIPVEDVETEYARIAGIDIDKAIALLSNRKTALDSKQEPLSLALKDEGRAILQKQLGDLKFNKWIYENKTSIKAEIDKSRKKRELANTRSLLTTNKITNETNRLADALITDAYIERFTNELKRLAPKIKVKLDKAPSQKGSTPYKVTIDTDSGIKCKPEDILSEGEQRIVALAAFFADATGREAKTPIIIDDPISSLDINYESTATQRIVEIALERQVIVFTHRISMLTGIEETCQRFGVQHKENYIRSTANGKGVPDFPDVYRGDVKKHLNGIKTRIAEIKTMDSDSSGYNDALGKQCQQFRICVERSVEDVLLQGMVHRFERRIMTNGKVTKLTRMTMEDCKLVDSMMTKYSFTEHSQPIDSPPVKISAEELNCDIEGYLRWINDYRKRMQ